MESNDILDDNDNNFYNFKLNETNENETKLKRNNSDKKTPKTRQRMPSFQSNQMSLDEEDLSEEMECSEAFDENDQVEINDSAYDESALHQPQPRTIEKILHQAASNIQGKNKVSSGKSGNVPIKRNVKWTQEEDDLLSNLVDEYQGRSWKKISSFIPGRTAIQCLHRWTKILKPGLVKGPWTLEEDRMLFNYVSFYGSHDFSECSKIIQGRNNKQCRERWFNVLNPKVIKGDWTLEEDYLIFKLYTVFGGKWIKFIPFFNGLRAENSIKNRFYSTIRRFNTVLRKKGKDNMNEKDKIDTIFNDFKSQLIQKYNIKSESELENFEKVQLGYTGTLEEIKDIRNYEAKGKSVKLGSDIKVEKQEKREIKAKDDDLDFRTKQFNSNISKSSIYTKNLPSTNINDDKLSLNEDQQSRTQNKNPESSASSVKIAKPIAKPFIVKDCFRSSNKQSSVNSSDIRFRNSFANADNEGKTSRTPFIKTKCPVNFLESPDIRKEKPRKLMTPSLVPIPMPKMNDVTRTLKTAQQCSISELENGIIKLCDKPTFSFKDEITKQIEAKIQGFHRNFNFDPFSYENHQNMNYDRERSEISTEDFNDDHNNIQLHTLNNLLKQLEDLESLVANTKKQINDNLSGGNHMSGMNAEIEVNGMNKNNGISSMFNNEIDNLENNLLPLSTTGMNGNYYDLGFSFNAFSTDKLDDY